MAVAAAAAASSLAVFQTLGEPSTVSFCAATSHTSGFDCAGFLLRLLRPASSDATRLIVCTVSFSHDNMLWLKHRHVVSHKIKHTAY